MSDILAWLDEALSYRLEMEFGKAHFVRYQRRGQRSIVLTMDKDGTEFDLVLKIKADKSGES